MPSKVATAVATKYWRLKTGAYAYPTSKASEQTLTVPENVELVVIKPEEGLRSLLGETPLRTLWDLRDGRDVSRREASTEMLGAVTPMQLLLLISLAGIFREYARKEREAQNGMRSSL